MPATATPQHRPPGERIISLIALAYLAEEHGRTLNKKNERFSCKNYDGSFNGPRCVAGGPKRPLHAQ